jgi:hypothetical protein
VRHLVERAGANIVRHDAVDRHHDAGHRHQNDAPHRGAQRHGGQLVGAGVAGHGDVGHAHADVGHWPISTGQASCHRADISRRILGRVKVCGMGKPGYRNQ